MEPEISLPCSENPVTGHHPEPDAPRQHLLSLFPQDPF